MASQLLRRAFRSSNTQILSSKTKDQSSARSLLTSVVSRAFSSSPATITATFFPGDGIGPKIADSVKQASLRVAEYAFHYATTHRRERVSAIHKANIMQKTDGLFLKCCCEVAEKYPKIVYEEVVIDNCCMMLMKNPTIFDVLVMPNLYGDIIGDLCAGLVGGLGLTPSCNIGEGGIALAEVVHGSAPDIAGKNLANPTALLLSYVTMLWHLELHEKANKIQNAILKTIAGGKYRTADLCDSASTIDFTKATCDHL